MRVGRHADRGELGVDPGTAGLGVLVLLEHHDGGALAHDEAVAAGVVGPRGGGDVVVAGGQGLHLREAGERQRVDRGLGATGDDDVGATRADHVVARAHRLRAGGAGRDGGVGAGARAELERDVAGRGVRHEHRDGEREDPAHALLLEDVPLVEQGPHAADAGADRDAEAQRVELGGAGILHGRARRDDGVLRAGVHPADLDLGEHLLGLLGHRAREVHRQLVLLEPLLGEGLGARPSREDAVPGLGDGPAEGGGGTESGHDDASLAHGSCCSLWEGTWGMPGVPGPPPPTLGRSARVGEGADAVGLSPGSWR